MFPSETSERGGPLPRDLLDGDADHERVWLWLLSQMQTVIRTPADFRAWLASQRTLGIDTGLLAACMQDGRVAAAAAVLGLPGGSGLLMLPGQLPARRDGRTDRDLAEILLTQLKRRCQERGPRLLQALTETEDRLWPEVLTANEFRFVTRLLHLRRDLNEVDPDVPYREKLGWRRYDADAHGLFVEVLARTYERTDDFPELTRLRSPTEALECHRAASSSTTQMWWLACATNQPVAVLLLASHPELSMVEVAYLGVVPSWRGRGMGHQLLRRALRDARGVGARTLALSVDRRNLMARRCYERWGFRPVGQRDAWICTLAV